MCLVKWHDHTVSGHDRIFGFELWTHSLYSQLLQRVGYLWWPGTQVILALLQFRRLCIYILAGLLCVFHTFFFFLLTFNMPRLLSMSGIVEITVFFFWAPKGTPTIVMILFWLLSQLSPVFNSLLRGWKTQTHPQSDRTNVYSLACTFKHDLQMFFYN